MSERSPNEDVLLIASRIINKSVSQDSADLRRATRGLGCIAKGCQVRPKACLVLNPAVRPNETPGAASLPLDRPLSFLTAAIPTVLHYPANCPKHTHSIAADENRRRFQSFAFYAPSIARSV